MILGKKLRQLRHQSMWPHVPYNQELGDFAHALEQQGNIAYKEIGNPPSQIIYQYLCDFVAKVADEQFGRERRTIKILDWGGGKGYVTHFLQTDGFDTTLYETNEFGHKDFWKKYKLKVVTDTNDKLPFKDHEFDIVVGFGVLEHVPYDYDALKEVNRVLKNDGLFMCFNLPSALGYPHHIGQLLGVKYHDRLYGIKETKQLLKRAGFNVVGGMWRRQLFPKNNAKFAHPRLAEKLDLLLCRYTPLRLAATSVEFVARKQYTYTVDH